MEQLKKPPPSGEDDIINALFYVITPELARKFLDLWSKYKLGKNRIDGDITKILTEKLDIDENLALYLQAHPDGFDSYFNEDNSARYYKNEELNETLRANPYDKKGDILPKFDCETIYIKKRDLIL
jgi:hypothetical protein